MIGEWHVLVAALSIGLAMIICAVAGRRHPPSSVTLAVLSFAWFGIDQAFEGPVLISFEPGHGLTGADLVGVAGLILAAVELVRHGLRWRRARRRPRPGPRPFRPR